MKREKMTREEAISELELISQATICNERREATKIAIEALQAEPVKRGEWVASRVGESSSWFVECSKCHVIMPPVNYTYCPHCGAKMEEGGHTE